MNICTRIWLSRKPQSLLCALLKSGITKVKYEYSKVSFIHAPDKLASICHIMTQKFLLTPLYNRMGHKNDRDKHTYPPKNHAFGNEVGCAMGADSEALDCWPKKFKECHSNFTPQGGYQLANKMSWNFILILSHFAKYTVYVLNQIKCKGRRGWLAAKMKFTRLNQISPVTRWFSHHST